MCLKNNKGRQRKNGAYRPARESILGKFMPAQNGYSCINLQSTNSMTITEKLNKTI